MRGGGHCHYGSVEVLAAHRAVELGVTVAEDAPPPSDATNQYPSPSGVGGIAHHRRRFAGADRPPEPKKPHITNDGERRPSEPTIQYPSPFGVGTMPTMWALRLKTAHRSSR